MGDLKKWTVAELKAELEKRELSQAGNKAALLGRLTAAQQGIPSDGSPEAEDLIKLEDSQAEDSATPNTGNGNGPEHSELDETQASDTRPEWESYSSIPENWLPIPLFMVRNIPIKAGVTESDVKTVLEAAEPGLQVRSVCFDDRPKEEMMNRRTAIVRLKPLRPRKKKDSPEPEEVLSTAELKQIDSSTDTVEAKLQKKKQAAAKKIPPQNGDAVAFSQWIVARLKAVDPPIQVGSENVQFEHGSPQCLIASCCVITSGAVPAHTEWEYAYVPHRVQAAFKSAAILTRLLLL